MLFWATLSYLKCKLIEHPDRPVPPPVVQPGSQGMFNDLAYHLRLEDFVGLVRFDKASAYNMRLSNGGRTANGYIAAVCHYIAVPTVQRAAVHYVKCTIVKLSPPSLMHIGIAQIGEPTGTPNRKFIERLGGRTTIQF